MLKDLVKIANKLDSLGFQREADVIDTFIRDTLNEAGIDYTYNWNVNWSREPENRINKEAAIKFVNEQELEEEDFIMPDSILSGEQLSYLKENYPEAINFLMSERIGPNVKARMKEYITNCMYNKKEINLNEGIEFALSGLVSGYEF